MSHTNLVRNIWTAESNVSFQFLCQCFMFVAVKKFKFLTNLVCKNENSI